VTASRPWVLGINASHNGSACLLHGDEIVVAIQEERLVGKKRARISGALPFLSLNYCMNCAGINLEDCDLIVLCPQTGSSLQENDVGLNPTMRLEASRVPVIKVSHHMGHALGAFCTSGFKESAILVIDGMGSPFSDLSISEQRAVKRHVNNGWETVSLYSANTNVVCAVEKHLVENGAWLMDDDYSMPRFRSIGGMYSSSAKQIFGDAAEAGKVMGLAPYGTPDILTEEYFSFSDGELEFLDKVPARFPHDKRWPDCRRPYEVLASSTQVALEKAVLSLVQRLYQMCPSERLCYAGGVALNSVANERVIRESDFKDVFIMPAAEDSGVAIGAAYYGLLHLTGMLLSKEMTHDAVGCKYTSRVITDAIESCNAVKTIDDCNVIETAVDMLSQGKIIGWFQGRSELGPRALGQRSILCDPRLVIAKDHLNAKIKHRESFRPFAPAVLLKEVVKWFDTDEMHTSSPFMLRVLRFREEMRSRVPAVVHVDGTGRVQTVTKSNNRLNDLLVSFYEKTGVPILLNTSFNLSGEPIVETPEDAIWCFLFTGLDACIIEKFALIKADHFSSILDFRPQLTINLEHLSKNGRLRKGHGYAVVNTPWGESIERFPASQLALLRLIDGDLKGRTILQFLIAQGHQVRESDFVCSLGQLRRRRIIKLVSL
jgi:carbamoyltransferase